MVGYTELHTEDEPININMSNLQTVEREAQKELYNEAYATDSFDTLNFTGIMPPAIKGWFEKIGLLEPETLRPDRLELVARKIPWEKNEIAVKLSQGWEPWHPGGHYFGWTSTGTSTRCYNFGNVENVYWVGFFHHLHGGSPSMLTGVADALGNYAWALKVKGKDIHVS